jgi:hypothetical protein
MNATLRQNKTLIRNFIRDHYPDDRLAMLLAHAQSGKLHYVSCCCFIGVLNADHALNGVGIKSSHAVEIRRTVPGAWAAEVAFHNLPKPDFASDKKRVRLLIPMIRAEFRRRDRTKVVPQIELHGTRA